MSGCVLFESADPSAMERVPPRFVAFLEIQDIRAFLLLFAVLPGIRDYDGYIYFREWSGGLLAGGFEPKAKPCFRDGTPRHFEFQLLQEDWDQFREYQ